MRQLLTILAALLLCSAPLHAQTLKSLMFNSTNGQVVANTGTNVLTFTTGGGGMVINGDGSIFTINGQGITFETGPAGTVLNIPADDTVQLGGPWNDMSVRAGLGFSTNLNTLWTATNSSNARSAVGIPLPALTNTSNVTMMRAFAGSTNTNQPYSGLISFQDFADDTHTITVSNGIITSYTAP